jgi:hypothetical protein
MRKKIAPERILLKLRPVLAIGSTEARVSRSTQGVERVWNRSDSCLRLPRDFAVTLNLKGVARDLDLLDVLFGTARDFQSDGLVDRLALSTTRSRLSCFGARCEERSDARRLDVRRGANTEAVPVGIVPIAVAAIAITAVIVGEAATEPSVAEAATEPSVAEAATEPSVAEAATEACVAEAATEACVAEAAMEASAAEAAMETSSARAGTEASASAPRRAPRPGSSRPKRRGPAPPTIRQSI